MQKNIILFLLTILSSLVISSCATKNEESQISDVTPAPIVASSQPSTNFQKPQSEQKEIQISKGDIFVISNRNGAIKTDCSGLGPELSSSFTYVAASLKNGTCEAKSFSSNGEDFFLKMNAELKNSVRPLVIFIHGSGQGFKTALTKANSFSKIYDTNIISLDWPVGEKTGNYKITNQKAKDAGQMFSPILKKILENIDDKTPVFIFVHSMGNFAFQNLVENSDASVFKKISRIILNASDVMLDGHINWVEKLSDNNENKVYILMNHKDQVITCSAGIGGFNPFKQIACEIIGNDMIKGARLGNTTPDKIKVLAKGATYLNVTGISGIKSKHEYYLGHPEILELLYKELLDITKAPVFKGLPHTTQRNGKVVVFR